MSQEKQDQINTSFNKVIEFLNREEKGSNQDNLQQDVKNIGNWLKQQARGRELFLFKPGQQDKQQVAAKFERMRSFFAKIDKDLKLQEAPHYRNLDSLVLQLDKNAADEDMTLELLYLQWRADERANQAYLKRTKVDPLKAKLAEIDRGINEAQTTLDDLTAQANTCKKLTDEVAQSNEELKKINQDIQVDEKRKETLEDELAVLTQKSQDGKISIQKQLGTISQALSKPKAKKSRDVDLEGQEVDEIDNKINSLLKDFPSEISRAFVNLGEKASEQVQEDALQLFPQLEKELNAVRVSLDSDIDGIGKDNDETLQRYKNTQNKIKNKYQNALTKIEAQKDKFVNDSQTYLLGYIEFFREKLNAAKANQEESKETETDQAINSKLDKIVESIKEFEKIQDDNDFAGKISLLKKICKQWKQVEDSSLVKENRTAITNNHNNEVNSEQAASSSDSPRTTTMLQSWREYVGKINLWGNESQKKPEESSSATTDSRSISSTVESFAQKAIRTLQSFTKNQDVQDDEVKLILDNLAKIETQHASYLKAIQAAEKNNEFFNGQSERDQIMQGLNDDIRADVTTYKEADAQSEALERETSELVVQKSNKRKQVNSLIANINSLKTSIEQQRNLQTEYDNKVNEKNQNEEQLSTDKKAQQVLEKAIRTNQTNLDAENRSKKTLEDELTTKIDSLDECVEELSNLLPKLPSPQAADDKAEASDDTNQLGDEVTELGQRLNNLKLTKQQLEQQLGQYEQSFQSASGNDDNRKQTIRDAFISYSLCAEFSNVLKNLQNVPEVNTLKQALETHKSRVSSYAQGGNAENLKKSYDEIVDTLSPQFNNSLKGQTSQFKHICEYMRFLFNFIGHKIYSVFIKNPSSKQNDSAPVKLSENPYATWAPPKNNKKAAKEALDYGKEVKTRGKELFSNIPQPIASPSAG